MSTLFLLIGGIALLVAGAEGLVRGAQHMAYRAGITPVVVGLTVVAFGTSAPELVVSVRAALMGAADIAVGNVVGSNLFNLLVILGLASVLTPLAIERQLARVDVPLMIVVSVVCWLLAMDGTLSHLEGVALSTGIVVYTGALIAHARTVHRRVPEHAEGDAGEAKPTTVWHSVFLVAFGIGALSLGARMLIVGATTLAQVLGVSELVIGLTIVAGGTSLPEVATSVVAAIRGQRDIAIGNVVGSNIFNLLAVLGAAALFAPAGLPVSRAVLQFDFAIMVVVSMLCLPVVLSGMVISRRVGAAFLAYYGCYITFILLQATAHPATRTFGFIVLAVAISSTCILVTGLVVGVRQRHAVNETPSGQRPPL